MTATNCSVCIGTAYGLVVQNKGQECGAYTYPQKNVETLKK